MIQFSFVLNLFGWQQLLDYRFDQFEIIEKQAFFCLGVSGVNFTSLELLIYLRGFLFVCF